MQPIVRGVVLASALALTGCSHPDAAMGRWYGRLVGGEAPTVVSRKDATGNRSRRVPSVSGRGKRSLR
jgi:hypothetical protein